MYQQTNLNDIADDLLIINKITVEKLYSLKNCADCIALYIFYYKIAKWQKTNIDVFFAEDMKVKIYAEETHTIRGIKNAEEHVDESGVSSVFWLGVDEKGKDCIVCIKSDQATYIHLMVTFIEDNFVICYNLIPDK